MTRARVSAHVGSAPGLLWPGALPFLVLLRASASLTRLGPRHGAPLCESAPGRMWPGRFPFRALYRARERNCLSSLTLRAGGFDSYCRCWRAGFVCAFARGFRAACSFTAGGEAGEP